MFGCVGEAVLNGKGTALEGGVRERETGKAFTKATRDHVTIYTATF